ncbi:MAG: hypothetical protein JMDDDDMK_01560 [Acidobacteria bacterium]|nr:hypothetical protein [Acidobacteriota bacterium]
MPVSQSASGAERINQVRRNNHATQTQTRKDRFTEAADINHPAILIESLQGCERTPRVSVLAVVIVFDDPGGVALRPLDERQAARQTHRDAERELM